MMTAKLLQACMDKLGYQFSDPGLLHHALTHRSAEAEKHNERLEFLGDAVLGCCVAAHLYQHHPQAPEGELSRIRANSVNRDFLAQLARSFELAEFICISKAERKNGGLTRTSILADTLEAVLGAIFVDGGFAACEACIQRWYTKAWQDPLLALPQKDAKTRLQEHQQAHKHKLPTYTIVRTEGNPHDQLFTVLCELPDQAQSAEGQGTSRRRAEQEAAERILAQLPPIEDKSA